MLTRRALLGSSAAAGLMAGGCSFLGLGASTPAPVTEPTSEADAIRAAMSRATAFMTDRVAVNGGYVWSYLPDFSRRWGELEAFPGQIWVQPQGTGTMGHLFLDAFHVTGDEAYLRAAEAAGQALADGQHPAGGWNYLIDTAGEESLRRWYDTIGRNGWRLEEFQHYYGNATFDDAGTAEASQLMLRLYLQTRDDRWRRPLDRAIAFVLDSQYPNGGWPQRFPFAEAHGMHGMADYTRLITFNDDVAGENIEFLLMVRATLGADARIEDAIRRAMNIFIETQQPAPQPGWGLQHRVDDLRPSAARSYEPEALATHTTATNVNSMMTFYQLTGDRRFLARLGEALDWLDGLRSAPGVAPAGRTHPTFIQIGTNRPLYIHRRGSNVVNGEYYADEDPTRTLAHYGSFRAIDVAALRARLARLEAMTPEEASRGSPLLSSEPRPLPNAFILRPVDLPDLFEGADRTYAAAEAGAVAEAMDALNAEGWWPTPLLYTSHPYAGDGSPTPAPGDFALTHVGDQTDTSPYPDPEPVIGISTSAYIEKMNLLLRRLVAV